MVATGYRSPNLRYWPEEKPRRSAYWRLRDRKILLLENFNGRPFRYLGGWVSSSPFEIDVPHSGAWNVVVDLGGQEGHVGAAVTVSREGNA